MVSRKGNILVKKKRRQLSGELFFFLWFSFQTRKDLALIKSYNAAVWSFLKTFRKYALKRL